MNKSVLRGHCGLKKSVITGTNYYIQAHHSVLIDYITYLWHQLSPLRKIKSLLDSWIKIQCLTGVIYMMTTVLLFLCLPFSQSAPEPDTHLHVYLPPEEEQGSCFISTDKEAHFFYISFHVFLPRRRTQHWWGTCGLWFEVRSSYNLT